MKMKVSVYDLNGNVKEKIELPGVFKETVRPDIIKRAVLALQSSKRQPYGSDPIAGLRTAVHYHGKRRHRWMMINRGMARLPRIHAGSPHMTWRVRRVPQAVKGRRAHPPKTEKIWEQKINNKEMLLGLKSAVAATGNRELIKARGHRIDNVKDLPLVVVDEIQKIKRTKELVELFKKIGLDEELERVKKRKIRSGKGKTRGRKYKTNIGPLLLVNKDFTIGNNIPGVKVCNINDVSVENLAPGAQPGRITIYTKSAIEELNKMV